MAREFARRERVSEELKRELGVLISTRVKDPRISLVVITDVDVSPDLKHAKVYVGNFDLNAPASQIAEALEGLRAARGFLKQQLGKRLRLRVMPELRFIEDATEREAQRLDQLITGAVEQDQENAEPVDRSEPDDHNDRGPS